MLRWRAGVEAVSRPTGGPARGGPRRGRGAAAAGPAANRRAEPAAAAAMPARERQQVAQRNQGDGDEGSIQPGMAGHAQNAGGERRQAASRHLNVSCRRSALVLVATLEAILTNPPLLPWAPLAESGSESDGSTGAQLCMGRRGGGGARAGPRPRVRRARRSAFVAAEEEGDEEEEDEDVAGPSNRGAPPRRLKAPLPRDVPADSTGRAGQRGGPQTDDSRDAHGKRLTRAALRGGGPAPEEAALPPQQQQQQAQQQQAAAAGCSSPRRVTRLQSSKGLSDDVPAGKDVGGAATESRRLGEGQAMSSLAEQAQRTEDEQQAEARMASGIWGTTGGMGNAIGSIVNRWTGRGG